MKIDTEYIKLDSFLKAVNVVSSGGEAKLLITGGEVKVNGEVEQSRGRKLYPGDRVEAGQEKYSRWKRVAVESIALLDGVLHVT